ncbi:MAG: hypothetical protein ABSH48_27100 [Verrucomicrobiota bacterium]
MTTDNEVTGNFALLDSFINVNSNCWYLSVTNLDSVFTKGYSLYFYYNGGAIGRGGQNYVRYYDGQTTNTPVLGTKQWNLYTTATNGGQFVKDQTPANTTISGETTGANYLVFSNLSGRAFDLLITNANYGGINALEIVANPPPIVVNYSPAGNSVFQLSWNSWPGLVCARKSDRQTAVLFEFERWRRNAMLERNQNYPLNAKVRPHFFTRGLRDESSFW